MRHAGMLDHLKVHAYGERLSLKSLASVSVRDSQLLAVSAFDPGVRAPVGKLHWWLECVPWSHSDPATCMCQMLSAIEKAIRDSALQLNPRVEAQEVLVPVLRYKVIHMFFTQIAECVAYCTHCWPVAAGRMRTPQKPWPR